MQKIRLYTDSVVFAVKCSSVAAQFSVYGAETDMTSVTSPRSPMTKNMARRTPLGRQERRKLMVLVVVYPMLH